MVAPGRITRIERLEHRSASNVDAPGRLLVFRVVIDPNGSGRNETVEQQIVKERERMSRWLGREISRDEPYRLIERLLTVPHHDETAINDEAAK